MKRSACLLARGALNCAVARWVIRASQPPCYNQSTRCAALFVCGRADRWVVEMDERGWMCGGLSLEEFEFKKREGEKGEGRRREHVRLRVAAAFNLPQREQSESASAVALAVGAIIATRLLTAHC